MARFTIEVHGAGQTVVDCDGNETLQQALAKAGVVTDGKRLVMNGRPANFTDRAGAYDGGRAEVINAPKAGRKGDGRVIRVHRVSDEEPKSPETITADPATMGNEPQASE